MKKKGEKKEMFMYASSRSLMLLCQIIFYKITGLILGILPYFPSIFLGLDLIG